MNKLGHTTNELHQLDGVPSDCRLPIIKIGLVGISLIDVTVGLVGGVAYSAAISDLLIVILLNVPLLLSSILLTVLWCLGELPRWITNSCSVMSTVFCTVYCVIRPIVRLAVFASIIGAITVFAVGTAPMSLKYGMVFLIAITLNAKLLFEVSRQLIFYSTGVYIE